MKRRIISALLALCMALTLLPGNALAEGYDLFDQYVFITGAVSAGSDDMNAIFLDGRMKTIPVDLDKSTGLTDPFREHSAIINSWCTYTVGRDGAYVLQGIGTSIDGTGGSAAAQWAVNVSGTDIVAMNVTQVSLQGPGKLCYGNDDTIYINAGTGAAAAPTTFAEADNPTAGNGLGGSGDRNYVAGAGGVTNAAIIDNVQTWTRGVQNVNIEAKNITAGDYTKPDTSMPYGDTELAVPKSEIYTLYGEDDYLIAVVSIGEDKGTALPDFSIPSR